MTQLTNRGLNAKRVEQWDRYLVPQNVFLVNNAPTQQISLSTFSRPEVVLLTKKNKQEILLKTSTSLQYVAPVENYNMLYNRNNKSVTDRSNGVSASLHIYGRNTLLVEEHV